MCHYVAEHVLTAATMEHCCADGSDSGRWSAHLADAQLAVGCLRAQAEDFNIDAGHIYAFGNSVGGHIAAPMTEFPAIVAGDGADQLPAYSSDWRGQVTCKDAER